MDGYGQTAAVNMVGRIKELLEKLSERERQIILLRFFRDKTQSEIAQIIGVIGFGVLVQFFVLPYMNLTYAGYYVELTKPKADAGFADGWTPEL